MIARRVSGAGMWGTYNTSAVQWWSRAQKGPPCGRSPMQLAYTVSCGRTGVGFNRLGSYGHVPLHRPRVCAANVRSRVLEREEAHAGGRAIGGVQVREG